METEKRQRKRFCPEGLIAHIILDPPPPADEIVIDGIVVDMSYSGIKIRLREPLAHDVEEAELRISLILPASKVPMSIHGNIRHVRDNRECGLQYADKHQEHEMDDLMFECVRFAPHETHED